MLLPRQLLSDLRDNPLAIGVYLLIARLYLVSHAPIPLGRADVLTFDPSLKIGAVKRAFDRLLAGGWLVGSTASASTKRHYTPSWGMVGGAARPWSLDAPALGRPRHLETLRVNRDLLDIGLGRLDPHPRHAAEVTRYLAAPALGLADLGAYALMRVGLSAPTPPLIALGLVEGGKPCAVPPAPALLHQLAQRSGSALSEHGRRKLGSREREQSALIGRPIGGVIGELIGSTPERNHLVSASGTPELPQRASRPITPGILRDSSDSSSPPPTPTPSGGGWRVLRGGRAERPKPAAAPVPETEATRLLGTIDVRPAQQIELADMPAATVEAAIADGRSRGGIRDLAGWVVYLLRQRRDHDWTPPPPAPRADSPEVLGAYFAQLAAEQEGERVAEQADEHHPAERPAERLPISTPLAPPPEAAQPPSLADVWQDTLASLRLRLPREVYQACVRQVILMSCADGLVTIGVSDMRTKDTLERGYLAALRFALGDALGHDVTVRIVHANTGKDAAERMSRMLGNDRDRR